LSISTPAYRVHLGARVFRIVGQVVREIEQAHRDQRVHRRDRMVAEWDKIVELEASLFAPPRRRWSGNARRRPGPCPRGRGRGLVHDDTRSSVT
jgi:hypothetical protein